MTARADLPPQSRSVLLLLLGLLTAIAPLSTDMYLPAFGAMAADLGGSLPGVQVTLATYFAGLALGQMAWGPLTDRFGRLLPLQVGLAMYTAAAAACALSSDLAWLQVMRAVQALGAGASAVITRAIVSDRFDVHERAGAFSRMMLVMGVAPILAPLLGGQLAQLWGWRAIFWLLCGFGSACMLACRLGLSESHPPQARSGAGWREQMPLCAAVLRDPSFIWPALACAAGTSGMFAYITGASFVFIELHGVPTTQFGLYFGANALALVLGSQLNALGLRVHGPERLLRWALLSQVAAGAAVMGVAIWPAGGLMAMLPALFIAVGSVGAVLPNATALAMRTQGAHAGMASALLGMLQFIGFGLAAAVVSWGHDGTAVPMGGALFGCAVLAWAAQHLAGLSRRGQVPGSSFLAR